jgi:hypothetical protein
MADQWRAGHAAFDPTLSATSSRKGKRLPKLSSIERPIAG